MIRTLCLIFAFAFFTNKGARAGDIILAANAILMQFVTFSAFFLDGYALAAETLVGQAVGARDRDALKQSIKHATTLALITSIGLGLMFALVGSPAINLLTNVAEVRETAVAFLPWVIAAPVISIWCYLLDGIFIGATRSIEMRNAMVASLAIFLVSWYALSSLGNHGLWAALMIYFIARAACLYWYFPALARSLNDDSTTKP
jgi:MATE family multidrug resistance protein